MSNTPPEMKCLCCRKPLDKNGYGSIDFRAYGNYGSKIWDVGVGGEDLPLCVWICDECILERKDCVAAFSRREKREVEIEWYTWDGMQALAQSLYNNPEQSEDPKT